MGFFSGLFGSKKTTTPGTGFYALPKEMQNALNAITTQGAAQLTGDAGAQMFTPLGQTEQESQAYNLMQLPTNQTAMQGLVSQYLNPFQDYITQGINKQAEGKYSLYKDALSSAGQMRSNREFINAAAADNARLNAIGSSMAGNYNNAQQTALNQNQTNIQNLLAQAENQRALDLQTKQAPISGLNALAGMLSGTGGFYPAQSQASQTVKSGGGLGGLLNTASSIASIFSDERLKKDIKLIGNENGHNIYKFKYKNDPNNIEYIGVMAQEVKNIDPEAVGERDGFMTVNYDKIGVKFKRA